MAEKRWIRLYTMMIALNVAVVFGLWLLGKTFA